MKRLLIIQPYLADYRLPVFDELTKKFETTLISTEPDRSLGFGELSTEGLGFNADIRVKEFMLFGRRMARQAGVVSYIVKFKPDIIFTFANPRYISFWATLIVARLLGLKVLSHGQGLYRKKEMNVSIRLVFKMIIGLSSAYIGYTDLSRKSLFGVANDKKLFVAENAIVNRFDVHSDLKRGDEQGVLFIGRLRENTGIHQLINVLEMLNKESYSPVVLHVIGSGCLEKEFLSHKRHGWIEWYGEQYDQRVIRKVSMKCRVGCYPGSAGLSIVHYMSLSLPPIVHDNLPAHMGPEPSYIVDGKNGFLFDFHHPEKGLYDLLDSIFCGGKDIHDVQKNAYQTYIDLTRPSMAEKIEKIIDTVTSS